METKKETIKNSANKIIESVSIDEFCMRSLPCVHDIRITYTDKSVEKETCNGVEILKKYKNYISVEDRNHFQYLETGENEYKVASHLFKR